MEVMAMVLGIASLAWGHRMSVVESDQPLAVRPMEGQRIVDAVRLGRRRRDARDDEPNPVATLGIDDAPFTMQLSL
ncbi:hypothetical protein STVA_06500 [Allostella vacuolata]|nr:hypothetical protein STVA_06500 [Stella vacuolata]